MSRRLRCSRRSCTRTPPASRRCGRSYAASGCRFAMPPDLRPVIVQDAESGRVLMLAWMDDEAERLTRETGQAWFWSRSRERLCHTGSLSCFAPALWRTVTQRALERPEGSYVTSLLDEGVPAAARKVGEEAVETVTAALAETDERLAEEAADLVFHLYVLLAARGVDLARVEDVLASRAVGR